MIPALATIIAVYVVFRCVSITLNALVQLKPHETTRTVAFVLILFGALFTAYMAIINEKAIIATATEMPEF